MADQVAAAFAAVRADERLVLLEGFHALKHALRFGADVVAAAAEDAAALDRLAERLAPTYARRSRRSWPSGRSARSSRARRTPRSRRSRGARRVDSAALLAAAPGPPAVLLEDPRHSATSARSCASPRRPAPPGCLRPARATRGTRPRCAAPRDCTSPCRSAAPSPWRSAPGRWSCSIPRATGSRRCPMGRCSRSGPSATASARSSPHAPCAQLSHPDAQRRLQPQRRHRRRGGALHGRSGFSQRSIVQTGVMPADSSSRVAPASRPAPTARPPSAPRRSAARPCSSIARPRPRPREREATAR